MPTAHASTPPGAGRPSLAAAGSEPRSPATTQRSGAARALTPPPATLPAHPQSPASASTRTSASSTAVRRGRKRSRFHHRGKHRQRVVDHSPISGTPSPGRSVASPAAQPPAVNGAAGGAGSSGTVGGGKRASEGYRVESGGAPAVPRSPASSARGHRTLPVRASAGTGGPVPPRSPIHMDVHMPVRSPSPGGAGSSPQRTAVASNAQSAPPPLHEMEAQAVDVRECSGGAQHAAGIAGRRGQAWGSEAPANARVHKRAYRLAPEDGAASHRSASAPGGTRDGGRLNTLLVPQGAGRARHQPLTPPQRSRGRFVHAAASGSGSGAARPTTAPATASQARLDALRGRMMVSLPLGARRTSQLTHTLDMFPTAGRPATNAGRAAAID